MIFQAVNFPALETIGAPRFTGANNKLGDVISIAMLYVLAFAGAALLVYLIIGGFKLMGSRGEPKAIQEGKNIVVNALVGFIIIFVSYWIVVVVGNLLNLDAITNTFTGVQPAPIPPDPGI